METELDCEWRLADSASDRCDSSRLSAPCYRFAKAFGLSLHRIRCDVLSPQIRFMK